jgi:TetR/AcrR family transcriptional regulator, transcriptional repressor for nem operon
MKKSKLETAETRRRIVDVAARQFRIHGIHATGLNELMSEAGLTRGGFYRHFESKDQLVAEACAKSFARIVASMEEAANENEGKDGFRAIVDRYVSAGHRDSSSGGCPLAGMGSELARADEGTRAVASAGFSELVELVAKQLNRPQSEARDSEAVFAMAAMIGAVTMSRVIADPDASTRVLQYVKQHLNALNTL